MDRYSDTVPRNAVYAFITDENIVIRETNASNLYSKLFYLLSFWNYFLNQWKNPHVFRFHSLYFLCKLVFQKAIQSI